MQRNTPLKDHHPLTARLKACKNLAVGGRTYGVHHWVLGHLFTVFHPHFFSRKTVHGCQEVSLTSRPHGGNLGRGGQVLERGLCDAGAVHHCHRGVHPPLRAPQSLHGKDAWAGERDWRKWEDAEASWGWGIVFFNKKTFVFNKKTFFLVKICFCFNKKKSFGHPTPQHFLSLGFPSNWLPLQTC